MMTDEQRKQAKIERLKWLRKQYIELEKGATPKEKKSLVLESAVLQKRLEVASRDR